MNEKLVYLDNAATTPVSDDVIQAMMPYFTNKFGNASSIYSVGRESMKAIFEAKDKVAKALNAKDTEIIFTGSGTEADNMAIKGIMHANKDKGKHIITSVIEHPAILETCRFMEKEGFEVTYLPVDESGLISLKELEDSIRPDTVLISIMFANNEIGTIQEIEKIGKIARGNGVYFHTDAVQAVGSIEIDVEKLNIDSLSLSGHKIYRPKGVGVLYLKKGIKISPIIHGGHQERGRRASTENVAGIVGLGRAIELACHNIKEKTDKIKILRDKAINEILELVPYSRLSGCKENRLPGNVNISFEFIEGEALLLMLDIKGIAASSGSACTSGSLDPSHVLLAIGLIHEIAHGSLRLSFGHNNTEEDVNYLLEVIPVVVQKLRDMSPLYEKIKRGV